MGRTGGRRAGMLRSGGRGGRRSGERAGFTPARLIIRIALDLEKIDSDGGEAVVNVVYGIVFLT